MAIHPTAVIHASAQIDPDAEIGPYSIIEKDVRIGPAVRLYGHVYIGEGTTIAAGCQIHPFASIGQPPQDLAFKGEPSFTVIGEGTVIREHVSIHRGTMPGSSTVLGKRCFLMACSHVAHNCVVGDDVKMANSSMLGGHVQVGNSTFIAGLTGAHQFVRVGELNMLSGARVTTDVVPFMIVTPMGVVGPNVVGLRRAGFTAEERTEIRECYRRLFRQGIGFRAAVEQLEKLPLGRAGQRIVEFIKAPSKRGLMGYRGRRDAAIAES